jgi:hypothetical protein
MHVKEYVIIGGVTIGKLLYYYRLDDRYRENKLRLETRRKAL